MFPPLRLALRLVLALWAKLARSDDPVVAGLAWYKSSYSGGGDGQACVEVAHYGQGLTAVRDSKEDGNGPVLGGVPDAAWRAFLRDVAQ